MGKRLFIAVKVKFGQETTKAFHYIQRQLEREKIKWVDPDNVHLTIKFLGDTDEELIDDIKQSLENITQAFPPTRLKMKSMGVFPGMHRPRVLWLGLEHDPVVWQMAATIEQAMTSLGFEPEERDFKPHITLGRIKFLRDRRTLQHLLDKYNNHFFQEIPVDKIILYESQLQPSGPIYTPLGRFRLGGHGN